MRRNLLVLTAALALLGALWAATTWVQLPGPTARLLPPGAVATQIGQVGGGRLRIVARLADDQSHYAVYDHLSANGWTVRHINAPRQDHDQVFTRTSLNGNLVETAMIVQLDEARNTVTILYLLCVRRLNCGLR